MNRSAYPVTQTIERTHTHSHTRLYGKKRYVLNPLIARVKLALRKVPDYRGEEYTGELEFD